MNNLFRRPDVSVSGEDVAIVSFVIILIKRLVFSSKFRLYVAFSFSCYTWCLSFPTLFWKQTLFSYNSHNVSFFSISHHSISFASTTHVYWSNILCENRQPSFLIPGTRSTSIIRHISPYPLTPFIFLLRRVYLGWSVYSRPTQGWDIFCDTYKPYNNFSSLIFLVFIWGTRSSAVERSSHACLRYVRIFRQWVRYIIYVYNSYHTSAALWLAIRSNLLSILQWFSGSNYSCRLLEFVMVIIYLIINCLVLSGDSTNKNWVYWVVAIVDVI